MREIFRVLSSIVSLIYLRLHLNTSDFLRSPAAHGTLTSPFGRNIGAGSRLSLKAKLLKKAIHMAAGQGNDLHRLDKRDFSDDSFQVPTWNYSILEAHNTLDYTDAQSSCFREEIML